jgi:pimeloyl-ACP methyl ester carboxylesterase
MPLHSRELPDSNAFVRSLRVPVDVGEGHPIVILHGFAMTPATYAATAKLLGRRARAIVPDLFDVRGAWQSSKVIDALTSTLDDLDLDRVSMIGHSFGGGIELGFATRRPERVVELVFSDTLAVSHEWSLADEALRHPLGLFRLATPLAARSFVVSWLHRPRQLVGGAWWGFRSGRDLEARSVLEAHIPAHVLWANRDSILSRSDGERFASELGASFDVARSEDGRAVDHDWMFQEPELFVEHIERLGLRALTAGKEPGA